MIKFQLITIIFMIAFLFHVNAVTAQEAPQVLRSANPRDVKIEAQPADEALSSRIREEFEILLKEYLLIRNTYSKKMAELRAEETNKDQLNLKIREAYKQLKSKDYGFYHRAVDIAELKPNSLAARDVLLWVLNQTVTRAERQGKFAEAIGRAVDLLVLHHFDDLDVARTALALIHQVSPNRDKLLTSLYDRARTDEVKATATLALALYLEKKSDFVAHLHDRPFPFRIVLYEDIDEKGKKTTTESEPIFDEAYETRLRSLELDSLRKKSESLFKEVAQNHKGFPYVIGTTKPKSKRALAPQRTLAEEAQDHLNEIRDRQFPSQIAPEITSPDIHGKPLRLSDYRGKIVLLIFWGSWCAPCLRDIPHEREIFSRLRDKPFVMLGVNCDEDLDKAEKAVETHQMGWRNWTDGMPGSGPIVRAYRIRTYPSSVVIDNKGLIRYKNIFGDRLDRALDLLLHELQETTGKAGSHSQ